MGTHLGKIGKRDKRETTEGTLIGNHIQTGTNRNNKGQQGTTRDKKGQLATTCLHFRV